MEPVIRRREHFDCDKHLILIDTYIVLDMHRPKLTPFRQEWVPVEGDDSATMLKIACGRYSK